MAARGERRRANAGCTHDPWPCCEQPAGTYGRPKGGICGDCRALIEEGKAARVQIAAMARTPFQWTERDYGFPGYYSSRFQWPHGDDHDRLKRAMFGLVNAAAIDAPADTPRDSPKFTMEPSPWDRGKKERRYIPWDMVLSYRLSLSASSWSFTKLVLLPKPLQQAIDGFDQAIRGALDAVYQAGLERGSSVLHQLASGEATVAQFEGVTRRKDQDDDEDD